MGGGKDKDAGRRSVIDKYEQSGRKSRIPAAYPVTMVNFHFVFLKVLI